MPTAPLPACLEPRCPGRAVARGYCAGHQRTTGERGYGAPHQQARASLAATLPQHCGYSVDDPRCPGTLITAAERWVAAHVLDGHPEHGWMVAHPECNERAKGTGRGGGVETGFGHARNDPRGQILGVSVRDSSGWVA
jgi:hypothetical protein